MAYELQVIVASTRPGRAGLPIGKWVMEHASKHPDFTTRFVDLGEVKLPMMDEPRHPRLRQYEHQHTKDWSATVNTADAFVIVTPEYNYGCPPGLLNAFDYLLHEWAYKPIGFVSYGGISAGLRSVQMSKLVASALRMMPIPEGVPIPFFSAHLKEGVFTGTDVHLKSLTDLLRELSRWTSALAPMREAARNPA